jgi:transcription elongation factor Elf1
MKCGQCDKKIVSDCCVWTGDQKLWICETCRVSCELTPNDKPETIADKKLYDQLFGDNL